MTPAHLHYYRGGYILVSHNQSQRLFQLGRGRQPHRHPRFIPRSKIPSLLTFHRHHRLNAHHNGSLLILIPRAGNPTCTRHTLVPHFPSLSNQTPLDWWVRHHCSRGRCDGEKSQAPARSLLERPPLRARGDANHSLGTRRGSALRRSDTSWVGPRTMRDAGACAGISKAEGLEIGRRGFFIREGGWRVRDGSVENVFDRKRALTSRADIFFTIFLSERTDGRTSSKKRTI